jgi:acetyl-CoA C-acetyltransferase
MAEAFLYDHVRTPRGKGRPEGALHEVSPAKLAAFALRRLAERTRLPAGAAEDVVLGIVEPVNEQGGNLARIAALAAGLGEEVAAMQLNRYCASGLEAVCTAAARVMAGQAELAIGGGVECMSRVKMTQGGIPMGVDPDLALPFHIVPQGIAADLLASLHGHSRADCDAYAAASQQRAAAAWAEGRFARSVEPVTDDNGLVILDHDEHVRAGTTAEALAALKPAFAMMGALAGMDDVVLQRYPQLAAVQHVHTPGNSSGIVDGAAAVLVGTAEAGGRLAVAPRARIKGFAVTGSEPCVMLTGPELATKKLLHRLRMSASDIDLFELNEAFSAVVLRYMDALAIPHERINVNGGAIAMGHPLGATGAMILGTLLDELERRGLGTGLATLCVGGGMGIACVVERV